MEVEGAQVQADSLQVEVVQMTEYIAPRVHQAVVLATATSSREAWAVACPETARQGVVRNYADAGRSREWTVAVEDSKWVEAASTTFVGNPQVALESPKGAIVGTAKALAMAPELMLAPLK